MMESAAADGSTRSDAKPQEKKRLNRAPSPARPSLKDGHSRLPKPTALTPKSPKLSKQQVPSASLLPTSRIGRRAAPGAKDKPVPVKSAPKSAITKKAPKVGQRGSVEPKSSSKVVESASRLPKSAKLKLTPLLRPISGSDSPVRVPTGRLAQTDSSSDLSDCPSEPLAASSDAESGGGSGSSEPPDAQSARAAADQSSPAIQTPKPATEPLRAERCSEQAEDLLREIEDLRSENDYLKDEVDELRAEMEEIRDSYLEEEMYQLQELRRELDRSNKNCRILQYRLRKAEQKSLRVAQTGHVDGELLRNLEQDLKVAKDVSVRLHNELETVEDKRTRAEDENEMLRQKIIEVEVSKQALHNELERAKEVATRRRGSRETFKEKKSFSQEDSADLRCQLQFSKEESALMRKKMAKLGREKDELEQELQKYKSVYGDVDSPLPLAETPGGGPHSTREAELRLRLKLVEEEANILGRKIVELEVENRGLRAENDDLRSQYERDCFGREPFSSVPTSPFGADAPESANELRRHLQFVEEEAELLRRSISEIEDRNKQLTTELNRFKFGSGPGDGEPEGAEGGASVVLKPENNKASLALGGMACLQEELKTAQVQINELSDKVMKLQYENRVLISNMQRCDLAAHLRSVSPRDSDADSDAGRRDAEEDEAGRLLLLHPKREGPVGGESDSEDLFERTATSGFGSGGKTSDVADIGGAELAKRRREEREMLLGIKREAERLRKMVDRLITDTNSLVCEGRLVVTGASSVAEGSEFSSERKPDSQVLDSITDHMRTFRTDLYTFMEKVDHLGEGLRDRSDDLSPMPNLTESSSFLSTVTSMSRDSPIGTLGRDLAADFQLRESSLPEVDTPAREAQFCLDLERRMKAEQEERETLQTSVTQEEDTRRLEARRGLELQGLQSHDPAWPQERALLHQEVRLFHQNAIIVYMKLRWILMNWRLRRRTDAAEERAEYERLESVPEAGAVVEQAEGDTVQEDKVGPQSTWRDIADPGPLLQSPERFHFQKQVGDSRRVLHALRSLLDELRAELREEAQRCCQLQQTLANERAAFEIQRAEMRSRIAQLEESPGAASVGGTDSLHLQQEQEREREEQRRLLADSHSVALELRWKLRLGERRWSREKNELLESFERERQERERTVQDLHRKIEQMQREFSFHHAEEGLLSEKGTPHVFSPQDSPCKVPRSPHLPRTAPGAVSRSHSDSETTLEERVRPSENLFLDALSLDPPNEAEMPSSSKLEREKRFPCLKEALNEISEREDPALYEEELTGGSLLRAKSVCSMSDFQRLMDSSPFLPDKSRSGELGQDDLTPPLSPDDLKYIEEFNNKDWDLSNPALPSCPIPGPMLPPQVVGAWMERADAHRPAPSQNAFQPASWYLTTSATLTTNTTSSMDQSQQLAARGTPVPEHFGVRVLHSPTRADRLNPLLKEGEDVFGGRWACDLRHLEGSEHAALCTTMGYPSSLELELSKNLSDDMKEVAFSVCNAIRSSTATGSSPAERQTRDIACQTNCLTTRGTQTISVALQTIASSPRRSITPVSSPSRRKAQYSPATQAKFERSCCSPKYGSPKLQRKSLTTPSAPGKSEPPATSSRATTPTYQPQKGNSESAWARSTTTRDSPVHATINDGLSSLFNIIDHTPVYDPAQKFNKSPSRSRAIERSSADAKVANHGAPQESAWPSRGRSPSPIHLIVEIQGEKNPETISIRQDLSAPPGYTIAENAARILNKKLLEQGFRDEKKQGSAETLQTRMGEEDKPGCIEDLPRSPVAPPLDSCFLRPARPANRRPPSRWAAHSPSSSPTYKDHSERFRFPSPIRPTQMIQDTDGPSQELPQPPA
ncbi:microtubule cross-linking factor 1 [Trichomycterus rosablanca]|uniref:microtubule cross-linking factor 1 n=1 Tax=Trichomycterus rosablanca TaxID=2290929 RepID=UPI002F35B3B4